MAMRFLYYRQFFTLKLTHESVPGTICEDFFLTPDIKTKNLFAGLKIKYKSEDGKITVYYSGDADPANTPPISDDKMIPFPGVENGKEFMFIIGVKNKNVLKKTEVPSPVSDPSFDILLNGKAVPWYYIQQPVFSTLFDKTASPKMFEKLSMKDSLGQVLFTSDVRKNNDGNFECSVDMSFFTPGFYRMELGTDKKNFYLDSLSEMINQYGFIRLVTDNSWAKPEEIYNKNEFNVFSYEFPEATYALTV